jgi:long-chain acyl-CoA synthetase
MKGYWRNESATAMTIIDGWLHTGDLATVDEDNYISIVGRCKDLIVTSGGDNVAPAKIESKLALEEEIDQAVVFGDGRPWLGAVIVPSPEFAATVKTPEELEKKISAVVKRVSHELNSVERIRKFIIRDELFTIDNGYVTPTQKIKRAKVIEDLAEDIDALYGR